MKALHRAAGQSDPVIVTERLELRPAGPDDVNRLVAEIDDLAVSGMLARVPYPYRRDDAEDFLKASAAARGCDLSLAITLGDRLIGGMGLSGIRGEREFGYWLGRAHWGKGYATEAGRAFLAHAFDVFRLAVVRSGAFVENAASLNVQAKLGFEQIGRSQRHCLARGRDLDHIDTILTRERFQSLHP